MLEDKSEKVAIAALLAAVMALAEKLTGEKLIVNFDAGDGAINMASTPGLWMSSEAFTRHQQGLK